MVLYFRVMKFVCYYIFLISIWVSAQELPKGFVYLEDEIPDLKTELRYYTSNNFIGKRIKGYESDRLIGTVSLKNALLIVQNDLKKKGLGLLIYDAYRPQQSVDYFVKWAEDLNDTLMKHQFYPNVDKRNLFEEGYIASKSSHTRGSTVDVTLVDLKTEKVLDMGSSYDYFGKESWVKFKDLSRDQKRNRKILQRVMLKHGFKNYAQEWWHFTLENEPYPETYFDFKIE